MPEEEVAQQAVELAPRAGEQPRDGDQLVDHVALPAKVLVDHALNHRDPVGQAQSSPQAKLEDERDDEGGHEGGRGPEARHDAQHVEDKVGRVQA